MTRIDARFATLKVANRSAFVSFIMAGDPNRATAQEILNGLPGAGVDIIEIGMPFTDPMADGPAIQLAGQRALAGGMTLESTLEMIADFRATDADTPVVLMGYYNPVFAMGVEAFLKAATEAGVDGLIIVDLPPEEDAELCLPALEAGLNFIRLATPTTDDARLPAVVRNTSGFVYYVSITGITGSAEADAVAVAADVERIRAASSLPVCVGFGIKTPEAAGKMAQVAEGVVVGSAIVDQIAAGKTPSEVLAFVKTLADAAHSG